MDQLSRQPIGRSATPARGSGVTHRAVALAQRGQPFDRQPIQPAFPVGAFPTPNQHV